MNARLMAVCTIFAIILAALVATPGRSAPGGAAHGLFEGLKVGQLVELGSDNSGAFVRTYEDGEAHPGLNYKITEIGSDFIAFDFENKEQPGSDHVEIRVPVYAFSAIQHVGKGPVKRPGGTTKKKN